MSAELYEQEAGNDWFQPLVRTALLYQAKTAEKAITTDGKKMLTMMHAGDNIHNVAAETSSNL